MENGFFVQELVGLQEKRMPEEIVKSKMKSIIDILELETSW